MAWNTTLVTMVRHLIGDLEITPKYSDARIQMSIVVAGSLAAQDYSFDIDYTFDFDTPNISPDPTLDKEAMALFSLKAACILNLNNYQTAVGTAIKVRDGDSQIDTTGSFGGYRDILTLGPCASYTKLLNTLKQNNSMLAGRAVISPGTSEEAISYGRNHIHNFFDYFRS